VNVFCDAPISIEASFVPGREFHFSVSNRIDGIVSTDSNIRTGEVVPSALPDDHIADFDSFSVRQFNPKILWV
jgi:hypothetical protein